jgi:hypothetical protein
MGDSKLLVDWANGKNHLKNLILRPTMLRVSEVFSEINFIHIYSEFNSHADNLSKDALTMHNFI